MSSVLPDALHPLRGAVAAVGTGITPPHKRAPKGPTLKLAPEAIMCAAQDD